MKRILLPALMALMCLTANSQEVFNEIYQNAYKNATNPKEDREVRKVESFKVDALDYLRTKNLQETSGDSISSATYQHLDSLAYYMYDYVNLFQKEMGRASDTNERKRVISIFRACSLENPIYRDTDREVVQAYCDHDGYITQFSLDTDWIKANAAVRKRLAGK